TPQIFRGVSSEMARPLQTGKGWAYKERQDVARLARVSSARRTGGILPVEKLACRETRIAIGAATYRTSDLRTILAAFEKYGVRFLSPHEVAERMPLYSSPSAAVQPCVVSSSRSDSCIALHSVGVTLSQTRKARRKELGFS